MHRTLFRFFFAVALFFAITAPPVARAAQTVEPVAWMSGEGAPIGKLQVTGMADPFEEYANDDLPQRGYRYIAIEIAVTNSSNRAIDFDPNDVLLVDDSGFLAGRDSVRFAEESGFLELPSGSIAPGGTVTGLIGFQMLTFAAPAAVIFTPESGRLITLFDREPAAPAAGEAVEVTASTGGQLAVVTVNAIADPFTGYEAGSEPPPGSHYLLADVTVINAGTRPLRVSPDNFGVVDSDGFFLGAGQVRRTGEALPNLEQTPALPAGESTGGAIVFQILEGTTPAALLYSPASDRIVKVAALGGSGGVASGPETAAAADGAVDCDAVVQWGAELNDRFARADLALSPIGPLESATAADAAAIHAAADTYETLAAEQEQTDVPAGAESLNTTMTGYLGQVALELHYFAEGLELDDPVQQVVALLNLQLEEEFLSGPETVEAAAILGQACPGLLPVGL